MNQDHDAPQPKPDENSLSDFECLLKSNSPVPVEIDTSVFDRHVSTGANPSLVSQSRRAPWPVAAASWFVGLATGLLVAVLAGGAFQASPLVRETAPDKKPSWPSTSPPRIAISEQATQGTATVVQLNTPPISSPDYIGAFSPNNLDLGQHMEFATRGLLVSFSARDEAAARFQQTQPSQSYFESNEPSPSTSVGSLRKQLGLPL